MSQSKSIAKNTLFLYVRLFFTMGVSLYTSRVVLETLGIQDYGVYSVVAGVVSMFGFFNNAMASATQRFLTFSIGENNFEKLNKTFNASLNLHILIGVLFLILAETIGLWFVNYKLNIQESRIFAANIVFQFSLLTFIIGIIQVPYNALIIAREKMDVFAYMSIVEVFLKLVIVYLLVVVKYDHLIVYAALYLMVAFLISMGYKFYCDRNFKETEYKFYYDKVLYKELLSFSGWTLFGSFSLIVKNQGINVLLNLFFGTLLNAAYGLTMQVQSAVLVFLVNLQVAFRPQIIINYANGNLERYNSITFKAAKFSFFLMLFIIAPMLLNIDYILNLWLVETPKYVSIFISLSLLNLLIESVSEPLVIANQATGKIKWFQIVEGSLLVLNIPIAYVLLQQSLNPLYVFYTSIIINVIALFVRLILVKNIINIKTFLITIIARVVLLSVLVFVVFYAIRFYFIKATTILELIFQTSVLSFSTLFLMYVFGLEKSERITVIQFVKNKILST